MSVGGRIIEIVAVEWKDGILAKRYWCVDRYGDETAVCVIAPMEREIAELRGERDQFMEQAAIRDKRDEEMQLLMRINNEQKERADTAESALSREREKVEKLEAQITELKECLKPFVRFIYEREQQASEIRKSKDYTALIDVFRRAKRALDETGGRDGWLRQTPSSSQKDK